METLFLVVGLLGAVGTGWYVVKHRSDRPEARQDIDREDHGWELVGLSASVIRMGDRLIRVEQQIRHLSERLDRLEVDTDSQPYGQAIRMVRNGAGIDDLVQACEFTRAEAELIVRLHGPKTHSLGPETVG